MSEGGSNTPVPATTTQGKSDRILRSHKSDKPHNEETLGATETTTGSGLPSPFSRRKRKRDQEAREEEDSTESAPKRGKEESDSMKMAVEDSTSLDSADGALGPEVLGEEPSTVLPELPVVVNPTEKSETPSASSSDLEEQMHSVQSQLQLLLSKFPGLSATWGTLFGVTEGSQDVVLNESTFSVGRSSRCNAVIKDDTLPPMLFRLHHLNGIAVIENFGTGNLSVNTFLFKNKGQRTILRNGDEITITGSKTHVYKFQVKNEQLPSSPPRGLRSPTAVAPSNLSSPSPQPARSRKKKTPSSVPSGTPKSTTPTSMTDSDPLQEFPEETASTPAEPSPELIEMKKRFKDEFFKLWEDMKDSEASFDNFPYNLDDAARQQLIYSAFVYLMKPDYVKFISDLPPSRKILLTGPPGTERYLEALVRALAKHFDAKMITLDPFFELEKIPAPPTLAESTKEENPDSLASPPSAEWRSKKLTGWPTDRNKVDSNSQHKRSDKVKHVGSHTTLGRLFRRSLGSGGKLSDYKGKVMIAFDENAPKNFLRMDRPSMWEEGNGLFVDAEIKSELEEQYDQVFIESLFEVVTEEKGRPCILFLKEAENTVLSNYERIAAFKKELNKISTPLIVIASKASTDFKKEKAAPPATASKSNAHHALLDFAFFDQIARAEERSKDPTSKSSKLLMKFFTNHISILPPSSSVKLSEWNKQIARDTELLKAERNKHTFTKVLQKNNLDCPQLESADLAKQVFTPEEVEKIVGWAVSHSLMSTEEISVNPNGRLQIPAGSISDGMQMLRTAEPEPTQRERTLKEAECENEFEKKLLAEVIPASELDIKFEDIGALEEVKQTLKELVMLPLQRPELFAKGSLTKPCKGILLFGPPGTGKTMLAKAVATQAGANFINVSMATIASKWFGEGEKFVKALFTLASKISPTVIFIDEVDSILGKRERPGEHEAMRKIKNEFMSNWDGLKSKDNERVLVLAATNRPFDLDDAVLRRLSRRLMVDLPSAENRVKILKVILSKEELEPNFDFESLATKTEGYSGSDMKNLSVAAAYQPIREILQKEKDEQELAKQEGRQFVPPTEIKIRPLTLQDFEKSAKEISASVSEDAFSIGELRKWNEMYGEGGSRKKDALSYFM